MGCPEPQRLADYHHGLLDASAREGIRAHVAACGACRREVDEMIRIDRESGWMEPPRPGAADAMPAGLWERIRAIRGEPAVVLRVTLAAAGGRVEVVPLPSGGETGEAAPAVESVLMRTGTRGAADPGPAGKDGGRAASGFVSAGLEGLVVVREAAIRLTLARDGRPVRDAAVTLTGPATRAVRRTGGTGTVTFRGLSPGAYLLRVLRVG